MNEHLETSAHPPKGETATHWGSPIRVLLLLLTCTAGSVDASSYLHLGHVFPANMTGNTVLLALAIGSRDYGSMSGNVVALLGFCLGVILGTLTHREKYETKLRKVTSTLLFELGLMVVAAALWQFTGQLYILPMTGLLAVAMGLQAAIAGRIALSGVSSVAITNTLTNAFSWQVGTMRHAPRKESESVPFLAAVWVAYFVGALVSVLGTYLNLGLYFVLPVFYLAAGLVLISVMGFRDER